MVFATKVKNQVVSRILSKEIALEVTHREYDFSASTLYILLQVNAEISNKANLRGQENQQTIPLPCCINLRVPSTYSRRLQIPASVRDRAAKWKAGSKSYELRAHQSGQHCFFIPSVTSNNWLVLIVTKTSEVQQKL